MSRWADAGTWVGDGLRREVFFFRSAETELYGSIYASPSPSSVGVLFCNSWGIEADHASRIVHPLSLSFAEAGGVAASFHYPGFGDSHGDLREATMEVLANAAIDALREASRRHPGIDWILAGLMLGASVACLVADRSVTVEELLLVQPVLRPGHYFERLGRAARRSIDGQGADAELPNASFAFGYPLPRPMLESAVAADAAVERALDRFGGEGVVVRYEKPSEIEGAPERFEEVCAPGTWRFGAQDNNHSDPALVRSTAAWMRQRAAIKVPAG